MSTQAKREAIEARINAVLDEMIDRHAALAELVQIPDLVELVTDPETRRGLELRLAERAAAARPQ